jgi:hypothetical protein
MDVISQLQGLAQPPPLALFGVNDPELVDWIEERLSPHPVSTYTQPVPPGNARSDELRRGFIYCTGNPTTTPDVFGTFALKAREKGWDIQEIPTGHLGWLYFIAVWGMEAWKIGCLGAGEMGD